MRLAILGAGKGGVPHIKAALTVPEIELVGVAEVDAAKRAEVERTYGTPAFARIDELLDRTKPDAVLVALPHSLHEEATLACIGAGAHVLVEKPLAETVPACERIIQAAKRAGRTLMVGQTHHFMRNVKEAKRLVDSGALGDVLMATDSIYSQYFANRPAWFFDPKIAGGGSWMANGVHLVDRTCWIMGELPKSVYARMTFHPEYPGIETSVTATLVYPSGRSATILMAMMANGPKEEGEILGTLGSVRYSAFRTISVMDGREVREIEPRFPKADARAEQLKEFAAAVREGREPAVTGEWGRDMVRIIIAGYESHKRGIPVSLDEV